MQQQTKTLPWKRHPRLQIRFKRNTNGLAGPEISYTNVTPMLKQFANCNANGNPGLNKSMQNVLQVDRQPSSPPANPASSTQPTQPSQPNPSTWHPASRPPKHVKFMQIAWFSQGLGTTANSNFFAARMKHHKTYEFAKMFCTIRCGTKYKELDTTATTNIRKFEINGFGLIYTLFFRPPIQPGVTPPVYIEREYPLLYQIFNIK